MFDETTNPVDGEAMPEVVDALASESEGLEPNEANQNDAELDPEDGEGGEPDPDAGLEDVEWEGQALKLPKGVKEALLRQADYTKKTQEVAELRKAAEARHQAAERTAALQAEFAQEIATLGALNAKLEPFNQVRDWPSYIRQGGAAAQADYAEFQALTQQRDQFANGLGSKVQQRQADEQREIAKQVEQGRAEIAKHIKDYSPTKLEELVKFAEPFGFSPEEIRQAESDPRSIRILHLASLGQQLLSQRKRTETLAQGQRTQPATSLKGAGSAPSDPRRMSPAQMAKHLGY